MAGYHGDIGQFGESYYRADEGNRIVVAVVLLVLLGLTGAHRFYLGETRFGLVHLVALLAAMLSLLSTAWSVALTLLALQVVILLGELVFLIVRAVTGR